MRARSTGRLHAMLRRPACCSKRDEVHLMKAAGAARLGRLIADEIASPMSGLGADSEVRGGPRKVRFPLETDCADSHRHRSHCEQAAILRQDRIIPIFLPPRFLATLPRRQPERENLQSFALCVLLDCAETIVVIDAECL